MNSLTRVLVLAGAVTLSNSIGSLTAEAGELASVDPSQQPTKLVVEANSDFAFKLYQQFTQEHAEENLFFSPYSMGSALAMAAEGARGQTADEMGDVLCLPPAARRIGEDAQDIPWQTALLHTGIAQLNRQLQTQSPDETQQIRQQIERLRSKLTQAEHRSAKLRKQHRYEKYELKKAEKDIAPQWSQVQESFADEQRLQGQLRELLANVEPYQLHIANALWAEESYPFRQSYLDTINSSYAAGNLFQADFKHDCELETERINRWVGEKTQHRITNLFPEGSLDPLTRLVLVNAIYFKGEWKTPFSAGNTKPRDFVSVSGDKLQAPIMSGRMGEVRYGAFEADGAWFNTPRYKDEGPGYPKEDGFAMVELPYKGNSLSMVVLAPNQANGIASLEKLLSADKLTKWISQCNSRKADILLPKFKLETKYFMNQSLAGMGMSQAFDAETANFTGMTDSSDPNESLSLSRIIHQTFLEVNEKGTEAVAATGGAVAQKAILREPFIPKFAADRPFIFIIRHVETGHILFMGRIMNPNQG